MKESRVYDEVPVELLENGEHVCCLDVALYYYYCTPLFINRKKGIIKSRKEQE